MKNVDKLQGNEREEVQEEHWGRKNRSYETEATVFSQDRKADVKESPRTITKGTSEWEGWGTALKPALEPITVARKPLSEKTVAENCLKWGVGGINIEACRVEYQGDADKASATPQGKCTANIAKGARPDIDNEGRQEFERPEQIGRFPANLLHDGSDEVVSLFPNSGNGNGQKRVGKKGGSGFGYFDDEKTKNTIGTWHNDSGSASRFFQKCEFTQEELDEIQEDTTSMEEKLEMLGISQKEEKTDISMPICQSAQRFAYIPKASKSERNRGCEGLPLGEPPASARSKPAEGRQNALGEPRANNHPTVKPIALMEYLVKLVSREGAVVLDPFAGSGSTLIACKNLGRNFIGIEKEADYIEIAKARLSVVKAQ